MGIFEIIAGAILILISVVIIFLVMNQEPTQQSGLSGAIQGGQGSYVAQGKGRNSKFRLAFATKIGAIIFFIVTIAVNLVRIFSK